MAKKFRAFAMAAKRKRLLTEEVTAFRRLVYQHHQQHWRDFPWRRTHDPYKILVSEVMLQQTQADRVVPKYRAFIRSFPTIRLLAKAPLRKVLAGWQGLGYNRRAVALQRAAQAIANQYGGRVPQHIEALRRLPGVGRYTAAAVLVFAFNQPTAMVETNIRSVFLHHFFPRQRLVRDDELQPLIAQTLDRRQPRRWYEAVMDYGAWLKKQLPNPGRRSRHYVRQSTFAGSHRQLRGQLIRAVLDSPRSLASLVQDFERPTSAVRQAVTELVREGLIARRGQTYIIQ
ncbi:MAG: A/G-specific adenine glycosylase [Candidatus Kerfeldbacteria bacterium]|nr:A/G-specific adenine glycosylase [Candidatus Kerfeldbacteria bacterium]